MGIGMKIIRKLTPTFWEIMQLIATERQRQITKWGQQTHTDDRWLLILLEELGEVSKAILEVNYTSSIEELVQAAAVITAWIEDILDTPPSEG
jgi:NTP pyrophosphatase (non-canonical NTP hydrolase)